MSKLGRGLLLIVLMQLLACQDSPTEPKRNVEQAATASFSIKLPPQNPNKEFLEFETPVDIGVRISNLTSVVISSRGSTKTAVLDRKSVV